MNQALLHLEKADSNNLSKIVYNVTSFNPTAQEFYNIVKSAFPDAEINFKPDFSRQGIVDSWPGDVDDSAAKEDWGWQPDYDQTRAFQEYLIPAVKQRYQ